MDIVEFDVTDFADGTVAWEAIVCGSGTKRGSTDEYGVIGRFIS